MLTTKQIHKLLCAVCDSATVRAMRMSGQWAKHAPALAEEAREGRLPVAFCRLVRNPTRFSVGWMIRRSDGETWRSEGELEGWEGKLLDWFFEPGTMGPYLEQGLVDLDFLLAEGRVAA